MIWVQINMEYLLHHALPERLLPEPGLLPEGVVQQHFLDIQALEDARGHLESLRGRPVVAPAPGPRGVQETVWKVPEESL